MSDKIKTLSQAIRLGATFRPQCVNDYFSKGHSCALGAGFEAITGYSDIVEAYREKGLCPASTLCERFPDAAGAIAVIPKLNDNGLTREHIADWLEAQGL